MAVTDSTLRAAAARTNGRLCELFLDHSDAVTAAARLDVVAANAGTTDAARAWCVGNASRCRVYSVGHLHGGLAPPGCRFVGGTDGVPGWHTGTLAALPNEFITRHALLLGFCGGAAGS